ncbi:MAG: LCP family protein, partial [Erysipelotrichaceae bacterium]|nr:LCP family protein [Erysipelotrichaceae bacterium]
KVAKLFNPMPSEGEMNINVYTLKDSQFDTVESLSGVPVAIQSRLDKEFQEYALVQINREVREPVVTRECRDIYSAVDMLYEGSVGAVLINETYVSMLKENDDYRDFDDRVRLVYQCVQKVNFTYDVQAVGNITKQPFVVGILGNDEYTLDTLSKTGGFRSDVNILCVVNPVTKQALVITVPRDGYVAVDGSTAYMDKLTHSPLYSSSSKSGIGYWISTMNTLLDCEINYTLKVNFISVVLIVNALGGLDIENPYEFSTATTHPVFDEKGNLVSGKYFTFPAGQLHLNGNEALVYCRERYGLAQSDFDRNKHQGIILRALIDKVTSPAILSKASSLLKTMEGNFTTNMKIDEMFALAQMQLDDLAKWDVKTVAVSGAVDYQYCYQLDGDASVVSIDRDSLTRIQNYIDQIMNNEIIGFD